MGIYRQREGAPRPTICELGGKNPSVVTDKADLEKAAEGIMHGAFGFGGQKCASNSRSYIHRSVYGEFVDLLRARAEEIVIGDPIDRSVYLGPLINDAAGERYVSAVAEARAVGTVVTGGERLTGGIHDRGNYVQPTIVEVPSDSWIWKRELFTPFIAVEPYDDLGRCDREGQRHGVRSDGRVLQRGRRGDRALPRRDRGGGRVRQPAVQLDDRRVAGPADLRWMEGIGYERPERWWTFLRLAVPAGTIADRDRELIALSVGTASLSERPRRYCRRSTDTATRAVAHVPSSAIAPMILDLLDRTGQEGVPELIPTGREEEAVGVVGAMNLVGHRSVVMMQDNGFGNALTAIATWAGAYHLPLPIFANSRGGLGEYNSMIHAISGPVHDLLKPLGVPVFDLDFRDAPTTGMRCPSRRSTTRG